VQVDAEILLIDEVLAVGDAAFQQKCHDEFNRLRDDGRTIVFVTHDMSAVVRFCDRAMVLERGQMVQLDSAERIAAEYFALNFGRTGQPTEREGAIHHGDGLVEIADSWFEDRSGRRVDSLPQGEPCAFVGAVRFVEALEDPGFGLLLENSEHQPAFATSTVWTEEHTGRFEAGELVGFRVVFDNVFAPGRYYATPSVTRRGSGEDAHVRVERMASVVVTGARSGGGIVDLPHDIRIERAEVPTG
jgi:ABC-2 type transport system ATP-binding protein